MSEPFKLNLVSEEVFSDKLDRLTAVLSSSLALDKTTLVLSPAPNDPTKFILSQNNIDVTQTVRDLILIDAPELQLGALQDEVADLKSTVAALQLALATKADTEDVCTKADLEAEVKATVAETQVWETF